MSERLCVESGAICRNLSCATACMLRTERATPPAPAQPVDLDRQVRDISAGIGLPPADDPTVPDPFLDCECGRRWAFDTRGWHAIAPTQPASAEQATVQPTTLQNAIAWGRLYDRAQALCAEIGYAGSVSTDDDEVELLMDALHAIDGGEWMPGLLPAVAAPAPSAEQQPVANRDTPALHEAARMALDALVALVPRVKHDATAREKAGRAIDALRAAIGEGEGN